MTKSARAPSDFGDAVTQTLNSSDISGANLHRPPVAQRDAGTNSISEFPAVLCALVRDLQTFGGTVSRLGSQILVDGPPTAANAVAALQERDAELRRYLVPSITSTEVALVRRLLSDAGVNVAYITDPAAAREVAAAICASRPDVVGVDFETEVLRANQRPMPVVFTKDGRPFARQPRTEEALDPYRSKVRLVQVWAGGDSCFVFDMRKVGWVDLLPLFELPLAIFNATFEMKRLIYEANIEYTGRIYDVMTAHWLTDGVRPSLEEAARINYGIDLPKALGASDWSSNVLSQEQLEYAALDAVLCRMLRLTQQELFDDHDRQCQEIADAVVPAVARMELNGMPMDVGAHRRQIAQWRLDLAHAEAALHAASSTWDLRRPAELQRHLWEVLDDGAAATWPRTDGGRLTTRRQQLQINSHLPGIPELLAVRSLERLINAFGEDLIKAINPVTGRLHSSFLIAGARTGRFSARDPNLQQMPKRKWKEFRRIFAASPGQVVMALDYSQIELRAVAELISEWFGVDSILRQHFTAGIDAHVATAMAMTGKVDPAHITPEERDLAKPCNFGLLYRMGNTGFFNYLRANFAPNITYAEACDLRGRFFAGYPDMARWQDEFARCSRELGYTQTIGGRRWKWAWQAEDPADIDEEEPFYWDRIRGFNGSYAVNHPVQGSCAEVMQIALARLDRVFLGEPVQLIATVHDEVVMLVPDDHAAVARIGSVAQREMVAAFATVFPKASTLNLIEPKVGPTWGDLRSVKVGFD